MSEESLISNAKLKKLIEIEHCQFIMLFFELMFWKSIVVNK